MTTFDHFESEQHILWQISPAEIDLSQIRSSMAEKNFESNFRFQIMFCLIVQDDHWDGYAIRRTRIRNRPGETIRKHFVDHQKSSKIRHTFASGDDSFTYQLFLKN